MNLPANFIIQLKRLALIIIISITPLFFFGQSLTGLWTGTLSNDSTSIRKDQSFEIALTEYHGKVYGYSRSEFIVNDTLYYIVKRVKGIIEANTCEVMDDEIISYNFPKRPEKGVKVISTFYRNKKDSVWHIDGKWKTNQTKKYYALTGNVELKEEKDLTTSKIFPHLQELNLADDVAFYKESKRQLATENTKTEQLSEQATLTIIKADPKNKNETTNSFVETDSWTKLEIKNREAVSSVTQPVSISKTNKVNTIPVSSSSSLSKITETKIESNPINEKTDVALVKPVVKQQQPEKETTFANTSTINTIPTIVKQDLVKNNETRKSPTIVSSNKKDVAVTKTEQSTVNKEPVVSRGNTDTKSIVKTTTADSKKTGTISAIDKQNEMFPARTTIEKKEIINDAFAGTVNAEKKNEVIATDGAATLIAGRKSTFSQIVNFKSDSLELSLYDNGEIDGDTVSILLNGEIILAKQGLKASAIKKTIYVNRGTGDEFNLVLYAENLGKYPPNTGLLVIHDGDDVYNVRFTADLQNNAGIIFRRKSK